MPDAATLDPSMGALLMQAPKSYPAGYVDASTPEVDKQHAKLAEAAKARKGRWDAEPEFRHFVECKHKDPAECDKCWTAETAARWSYAVGLTDEPGPALDKPEEPGKGRANAPTLDAEKARINRSVSRSQ